jgi:hypothetical protein
MNNKQSINSTDIDNSDSLSNVDMLKITAKLEAEDDYGSSSKDESTSEVSSYLQLSDIGTAKESSKFSDANHSDRHLEQEEIKNEVKLETKDDYGWNSKAD